METPLHGHYRLARQVPENQVAVMSLDSGDGEMGNISIGNNVRDNDVIDQVSQTGAENNAGNRTDCCAAE